MIVRSHAGDRGPWPETFAVLAGGTTTVAPRAFAVSYVLNEHGLIIADYNSWFDCQVCINLPIPAASPPIRIPFMFQNHRWVLIPTNQRKPSNTFKLSGVALTRAGQELSRIVDLQPMNDFEKDLKEFFQKSKLQMTKI